MTMRNEMEPHNDDIDDNETSIIQEISRKMPSIPFCVIIHHLDHALTFY